MKLGLHKLLTSSKYHSRLLVALAILLPFEYIPSYEFFGLRVRLSLFIGLAIIACAGYLIVKKIKPIRLGLVEYLLIAWLSWVALSFIAVSDTKQAIQIILPLIFYGLLALSIPVIIKKTYLKSILTGLMIGAGLAVGFGFYQFIGNWLGAPEWATGLRGQYSWQSFGFPRMQSTALEPLYFSAYLLLPIAVLASLAIYAKTYRQIVFTILFILMIIADVLTLSRGGLAALVLLFFILGIFYIRRISKKSFVYVSAGLVIISVLSLGIISITARQGSDNDVTYGQKGAATFVSHLKNFNFFATSSNKSKDDSVSQRDQARTQARQILADHPKVLFFGAGAGQYQDFNKKNYQNPNLGEPNNLILEQLVQFGLVGLLLFVSTGAALVWRLYKTAKTGAGVQSALAIGLFAYFLALFLQAQTFTGLALTHLWFAVGLAFFLIQSEYRASSTE